MYSRVIGIVLLTGFYLILCVDSTVDVLYNYCCFFMCLLFVQYLQCASLCRYICALADASANFRNEIDPY